MSKLGDFIAFRAAIARLKDHGQDSLLDELYARCKEMQRNGQLHLENIVRQIYKPFSTEEISAKIAELITPPEVKIPVQVIFQTIEDLHLACPTKTRD